MKSSLAQALTSSPFQRAAAAALRAQGSHAAAQICQKYLQNSSQQERQSSSGDREQSPWYQVRWQLGVAAAATAGLIGSSRCADDNDDEEEIQVTYLPLSLFCRGAYLSADAHGMLAYTSFQVTGNALEL